MTVRARLRATVVWFTHRPQSFRVLGNSSCIALIPSIPGHMLTLLTYITVGKRGSYMLLLLLPLSLMADYQSGLDAYNRSDYTTALQHWKAATTLSQTSTAAAAIQAETHYAIGMLYWTGQGVTKDYFKASKWMHQAADLNHAGAQTKLGYLYTEGIAVEQDYEQAFHWFTQAARQGNIDGQYNLGIFYLNGWGTPQNKTMAAQYLAAASTQGDVSAEKMLQSLLPFLSQQQTSSVLPTAAQQQQTASAPPQHAGAAPPSATTSRHSGIAQTAPPRHSGIAQQLPESSQEPQ